MRNHDQGNSVTHLIVFYFNCYWMNRVLLIWLAPGTLNWKYYNEDLTRIVVWYVILFLYHAFYHIREIKHAKYGMVWHILWHGGQKAEQQNGHTKWSKLPFLRLDFSRNNFLAPSFFFLLVIESMSLVLLLSFTQAIFNWYCAQMYHGVYFQNTWKWNNNAKTMSISFNGSQVI